MCVTFLRVFLVKSTGFGIFDYRLKILTIKYCLIFLLYFNESYVCVNLWPAGPSCFLLDRGQGCR